MPGVIATYLRGGVEGVANLFTCDSRCTWVLRKTHSLIVCTKTVDPDNEKYKYDISSMSLRLLRSLKYIAVGVKQYNVKQSDFDVLAEI